jgi:hypothetical protein
VNDEQRRLVQAAKDHHAKSTKGDWKTWGMNVMADVDGTSNVDTAKPVCKTFSLDEHGHPRTFDANFIAHAHNNMPALIAIIEEQEAAHQAERKLWQEYVSAALMLTHCHCLSTALIRKEHARQREAADALIALGAWPSPPLASSSE